MRHRVLSAQNVSRMCAVCGVDNASGLGARFLVLEGGALLGVASPAAIHQSYPGRMHGGVASMLLDETIGRAINIAEPEAWGVTIELSVTFRKPVPLDAPLRAVGRITKVTSRGFEGTGELLLGDGTPAVTASGRYLKLPIERIAEGDFHAEWFVDERPLPEYVDL